MVNFLEEINDDLLDSVYLAKKRINDLKPLFETSREKYYLIDNNIVLCSPLDESDVTFRLFNTDFRKTAYEPLLEIYVDPNTTEIKFISTKLDKSELRFKASFDHIEKNWDVRSFMNGTNKLSTLNDSLLELNTLPYYGREEFDGFSRLIYVVQTLKKKNNLTK